MSPVAAVWLVGFVCGIPFGALCLRACDDLIHGFATKKKGEIGEIGLRRFWIGNDEFKIYLCRVKEKDFAGARNYYLQTARLENTVEEIVSLIIGYDLKWFKTSEFREAVQIKVDDFVADLERYNEFIERPEAQNDRILIHASVELEIATQPILDSLEELKNEVTDYVNSGDYKLIEFES